MLPQYPVLRTPPDCVKGRHTVPQLSRVPRGASSACTPSPLSHRMVIVSDEGSTCSDDEESGLDNMKAFQTEDHSWKVLVSDGDSRIRMMLTAVKAQSADRPYEKLADAAFKPPVASAKTEVCPSPPRIPSPAPTFIDLIITSPAGRLFALVDDGAERELYFAILKGERPGVYYGRYSSLNLSLSVVSLTPLS